MSKYGILVSKTSIDNSSDITFDGRKDTLKLDIDASKQRVGLIKYKFSSNPPIPPSPAVTITKLITINHNLGYKPAHILYWYNYDAVGPGYFPPGSYSDYPIDFGGGLLPQQRFDYYMTDKILQIDFITSDLFGFGLPPAIDLTGKSIWIKYFIFSNPVEQTEGPRNVLWHP